MKKTINRKIQEIMDIYIIERSDGQTLNDTRKEQIAKILSWCALCSEEVLIARLENELSSWPMPKVLFGSSAYSQSKLWRDVSACIRRYYQKEEEMCFEQHEERYERYEMRMSWLFDYIRRQHHDDLKKINMDCDKKVAIHKELNDSLNTELGCIKQSYQSKNIKW
mgnify:CR=1 FL=1|tara:strand:- start:3917 stop:4414 length:498 start_codon:yes stop_codon:yes gene_type:complete